MYYAGCNYWVNTGKVPGEPIGTALSMHDCDGCEHASLCPLKKPTELWEYSEDIAKEMDALWRQFNEQ